MSQEFGFLREIRAEDLEVMLEWRNAPSVRANMYTRHEISKDEHLVWWERTRSRIDQLYFMYEYSGKNCGIVAFTGIDNLNGNSSWAFYASTDAAKGTGSRMEFLALDYAFDELKLHKLHCEVLAFNSPVIKLHQKYGFKVEGVFREHHVVDGEHIDIYRLGILAAEWKNKRPEMKDKLSAFSGG
ncbi:UDP-4-amino-4,6-dideoxy-N-acetyl-beta-L-altrosamine N-acetyltransferase [Pseudomonas aeruginosa]|nr:UDP-4-amino-4,6-dideoxy-N-acetyl-beta-L-altrosamine N-acetyltransferase [Pseudomonas aeruginosa]EKV3071958.1 UDP-4-amino-4,6-dideoxy-N-acetyl-beta-L-altrosamine N-acetyltransferase [Pseudomonas aeruginosa]MCS8556451.1 UDP-4-amino-4,6-dideoxy-N-acetyl-beta-L-altrosamine N-acetyltransferase [Pseudomonas aeruginosa]MCT0517358.1 UDP-4-amino-4,6-dideoxy-N-acetyl-beta-L-altrosamine N-acetyltransferase [Pseudomonas aeruginosa]MCT0566423.1 UDP-4-amino-4,6-dideoxy-N-acetyl-beta-L-altrosamine N-acetyl